MTKHVLFLPNYTVDVSDMTQEEFAEYTVCLYRQHHGCFVSTEVD